MDHLPKVLVAFSDAEHSEILAVILGHCGVIPVFCSSLNEAKTLLGRESIRLVFCEERLGGASFRDVVQVTSSLRSDLPLVVFSRFGNWKLRSEALQLGALDCIGPPLGKRQIEEIVHKALCSVPARTGSTQAHHNH